MKSIYLFAVGIIFAGCAAVSSYISVPTVHLRCGKEQNIYLNLSGDSIPVIFALKHKCHKWHTPVLRMYYDTTTSYYETYPFRTMPAGIDDTILVPPHTIIRLACGGNEIDDTLGCMYSLAVPSNIFSAIKIDTAECSSTKEIRIDEKYSTDTEIVTIGLVRGCTPVTLEYFYKYTRHDTVFIDVPLQKIRFADFSSSGFGACTFRMPPPGLKPNEYHEFYFRLTCGSNLKSKGCPYWITKAPWPPK